MVTERLWKADDTGKCCLNCRRGPEAHEGKRCPLTRAFRRFVMRGGELVEVSAKPVMETR